MFALSWGFLKIEASINGLYKAFKENNEVYQEDHWNQLQRPLYQLFWTPKGVAFSNNYSPTGKSPFRKLLKIPFILPNCKKRRPNRENLQFWARGLSAQIENPQNRRDCWSWSEVWDRMGFHHRNGESKSKSSGFDSRGVFHGQSGPPGRNQLDNSYQKEELRLSDNILQQRPSRLPPRWYSSVRPKASVYFWPLEWCEILHPWYREGPSLKLWREVGRVILAPSTFYSNIPRQQILLILLLRKIVSKLFCCLINKKISNYNQKLVTRISDEDDDPGIIQATQERLRNKNFPQKKNIT